MWVGIGLVSLILVFPKYRRAINFRTSQTYRKSTWSVPVTRTKLCLIVPAVTAGLIVTYKNKKQKDKPKANQKQ